MSAVQCPIDTDPGSKFMSSGDFNLPDTSRSNDDFGLTYNSTLGPGVL